MEKDLKFLEKLTELAKQYGWHGDYIEVEQFVEWVYREMDEKIPDLEPYPYD